MRHYAGAPGLGAQEPRPHGGHRTRPLLHLTSKRRGPPVRRPRRSRRARSWRSPAPARPGRRGTARSRPRKARAIMPMIRKPVEYPLPRAVTACGAALLIATDGGTELTATGPAPSTAARRADSEGSALTAVLNNPAALLSAIAPTTAGPRANPKSRTMLGGAAAMPASFAGTGFTTVAVTHEAANAKPTPTRPIGTSSDGSAVSVIDMLAASS